MFVLCEIVNKRITWLLDQKRIDFDDDAVVKEECKEEFSYDDYKNMPDYRRVLHSMFGSL